MSHTGRVQQGKSPQEGEAADQGNFSQVCPCLFSTGWLQMEPGEDGEVEAQRRLHQWLCHERLAIAMALAGSAAPHLGARRPRHGLHVTGGLPARHDDPRVESGTQRLAGRTFPQTMDGVLACHRCLPVTSTSLWKKPEILSCRSFLWTWPCMWASWKDVSSSAVHMDQFLLESEFSR